MKWRSRCRSSMRSWGRDSEAAKAYLLYVEGSTNSVNGPAAMQNALAAIGRMKVADPQSAEAEALLDRALPLAVHRFGRLELAYDLGRRLQQSGKYAEAASTYAKVPEADKRWLTARLLQLQARKQDLDANAAKLERNAQLAQVMAIRALAEDVCKRAGEARVTGGADPHRYALIEARARLLLAGVLRDREPAQAIAQLEGFEKSVAGISGEDELVAEALFIRVNSQMAMARTPRRQRRSCSSCRPREATRGRPLSSAC